MAVEESIFRAIADTFLQQSIIWEMHCPDTFKTNVRKRLSGQKRF